MPTPTNVSYLTYANADSNPNGYPGTWVAQCVADANPQPSSPWVTVSYSAFQDLMATQQSEFAAYKASLPVLEVDDTHGPIFVTEWVDDWISPTTAGRMGWSSVVSGIGALTQINTSIEEPDSPGIVELRTGTVVGGRACLSLGMNSICLGGGALQLITRVRLSAVADGSNEWLGKFGLGDNSTGASHDDEITVGFDYDLHGGNWHLRLTNGATAATTTVDLGVAPVANTWTKITILVNDTATAIQVYIDGALRTTYTNATYIPKGSGRSMGPYLAVSKAVGLTLRTMYADYVALRSRFSTTR